jgi:hypothetical protein
MKLLKFIILFLATLTVDAQTSKLIVPQNIILPKDSIEAKLLITSLERFLIAAQKSNEENNYILPSEKIETFIQQ